MHFGQGVGGRGEGERGSRHWRWAGGTLKLGWLSAARCRTSPHPHPKSI